MALQYGQVLLREPSGGLVELLAHVHTACLGGVVHLNVIKEPLGYNGEGIVWPALEPVYGAAVDERGELAEAVAEGIADEAHGQDHVQVVSDPVYKHVEESQRCAICLFGLLFLSKSDTKMKKLL